MFPRKERLSRTALSRGLRSSRRRSSEHFSATLPEGRGYAVVISKKTLGRAVDRHRLKRRVLETLKLLPERASAAIIYPKASAGGLSAPQLRAELAILLTTGRS